jgi:hypothetical protein
MFNINPKFQPNGFVMSFDNGWSISVQWGKGNYSSNRMAKDAATRKSAATAEVAIYDSTNTIVDANEMLGLSTDGLTKVVGWMDADSVVDLMSHIKKLPQI